jgi:phenylacetate-coenzyme A ligase PaaK-like adenylate-forming protein
MNDQWNNNIFNVGQDNFERLSLDLFHFQYCNSKVYKAYTDALRININDVRSVLDIPFLPIGLFKSHKVKTTEFQPELVFESSGTTQSMNSHHLVKDIELYRQSLLRGFELFYGSPRDWCIIALLPSYLERKNSSLVFMMHELIENSGHVQSGFYLYEHEKLYETLKQLESQKQKTFFIGVSFALLDFAEQYSMTLKHTVIVETGGMKGRKQEMVRDQLHHVLKDRFEVDAIHSEYGMTELLSQAYSEKGGIFQTPPWMKVLIRDEEDPLVVIGSDHLGVPAPLAAHDSRPTSKTGAINIIDLANAYSCAFVATDDAGKLYSDGSFEVLGRIDDSDIRGCSLMVL